MGYPGLGLSVILFIGIQLVEGTDIWGRCPQHWDWYNGRCFLVSEAEATYPIAESRCRAAVGKLAAVDTEGVQQFINNIVHTRNNRRVVEIRTGPNDITTQGTENFTNIHDLGIDVSDHTSIVFSVKVYSYQGDK